MILQCEGNTREVSCCYEFSSFTVIGVWFSYNQLSIISLHCCIPINYNSTANCVTYAILPVLSYCLPYFMTHHTKNRIDYRTIPCFHSFNLLSHMPAFGCFVMMVIHMYSWIHLALYFSNDVFSNRNNNAIWRNWVGRSLTKVSIVVMSLKEVTVDLSALYCIPLVISYNRNDT